MSSEILFLALGIVVPGVAGVWLAHLTRGWQVARWPSFGAGALAGAALLVVLPEVWSHAAWLLAGFAALAAIDRFAHPLCARCQHSESAGALWPLWLALGAHSLLDGALLQMAHPGSAVSWVLLGHRVPEALAMVTLLRSVQPAGRHFARQVAALQGLVALGALAATALPPEFLWKSYAFAGGAVLFLALHRLHRSWRESTLCWSTSLAGLAGVALVQLGLRWIDGN